MVSARGGLARAMVALGVAAGLVVTSGACTTQTQRATPATLTAAPAELGVCEPDQLARCVPGLADLEENLFGGVAVYESDSDFSSVSPSAAREAAPKECQHLPRLGASDRPELDVEYQPAKDTDGKPLSNRFPANGGEYVRVRFTVGHNGYDVTRAMGVWAHRCPMWGFAQSMSDNDIHGWLVAESAASLSRYQAGDVDYQWPAVIDTADNAVQQGDRAGVVQHQRSVRGIKEPAPVSVDRCGGPTTATLYPAAYAHRLEPSPDFVTASGAVDRRGHRHSDR